MIFSRRPLRANLESCKVETTVEKLKRASVDSFQALIAFALAVGKKMGKDEALRTLLETRAGTYSDVQTKWAKENMPRLGIKGNDALTAYELIQAHLRETGTYTFGQLVAEPLESGGIQFVEKSPKRVVYRHQLWCPVLEACKNLNVEPRYICEKVIFPEWERVIKSVVNPKAVLRANKVRPEADYCEEIYEIED